MTGPLLRLASILLLAATLILGGRDARAADADVATAWRLLDYIAVDYEGAVEDGKVINEVEYQEQVEFAGTVANTLAALPEKPGREALVTGVAGLQKAIADKAAADDVAALARRLGGELLAIYPVAVAPARAPDLARGEVLYGQQCASCHGVAGDGKGPAAAALEVPPIDFTDHARARQRSLFALYQATTQGIDGTPMPGFAHLSSDDRWALAFHVGQFAFPASEATQGQALWQEDAALKAAVPDLKSLADTTPAALESRLGAATADALTAYLRRHPEAVVPQGASGSLALARTRLAESLAAYRAGDARKASSLALSSYLDGFETVEPALAGRDGALLGQVEMAMGELRAAIQRGEDAAAVQARVERVDELLVSAQAILASGPASQWSTFLGAATILLREGLEALLIIIAMLAFLRKAERVEVVRYVHAGWISALVAGVFTWIAATWLIRISGASRELTEGFGSILAAVVLVSVGIWMHGKAHADQWQRYIREKMSRALSGRTAWLLLGLAFIVVYREVFETILFFAALWSQGNGGALLGGAASAAALLAIIAWAMLRFSQRLPLGKFFSYSSWLMAVIAVVLAGKGISALQEAGMVDITPLATAPRMVALGIYPTWQTILAQVAALVALLVGFAWNRRSAS
ncbi:MAG: FTR1 family protein [Xanthomonadales bacterium]|nr:FTR1 family protein [Xanthomonadales bacterium]